MAADEARSGMGSLQFWGNTPATDLLELVELNDKKAEGLSEESHILIIGQGDGRHILKTLSDRGAKDGPILHVYIVEGNPVLYARQLLLLHLAFLPPEKMGIHEKVTEFMDIFGNSLIRPQSRKTIRKCSETLIKMLTDETFLKSILPFVHLDDLKHRERDSIADAMKFWMDSQMSAVEIRDMWDLRLRKCLGQRYDTRIGAFDWDYQMRMIEKNKDTKIVHVVEYKDWRNTGLAFSEYENDYNQANVTLFAGKNHPFCGDILVGPFIPYGIHTDDQSYFETGNREYKKKSRDVTFHNLEEIFTKLSSYKSSRFQIHFLPLDTCSNLWKKSKFQEKFDLVLMSNFSGHQLTPELTQLIKKDGTVLVDKSKYMWYFKDENDKAYGEKLQELGKKANLTLDQKDVGDHLVFTRQFVADAEPNLMCQPMSESKGCGDC